MNRSRSYVILFLVISLFLCRIDSASAAIVRGTSPQGGATNVAPQPELNPPLSPPSRPGERSMYVWDTWTPEGGGIINDPAARAELLQFSRQKGIKTLFLNADGVVYGTTEDRRRHTLFIRRAHRQGLLVFALQGYTWWTIPRGAIPGQPSDMEEGWVYVDAVVTYRQFDGLIDDSEPYLVDGWWENVEQRAQWLLDWLHGVKNRTRGVMPCYATIPFWYDQDGRLTDLYLDGSEVGRPLNQYVSNSVDCVNIMDYRDTVYGGDGLLTHASGELGYGPTIISVETQYLGDGYMYDRQTFYEEGEAYMEKTLGTLYNEVRSNPNFMGYSIHHYTSYRDLRR